MHVVIDGIDISILEPEVKGSEKNPSFIFVHGAGGDASIWGAQADYFGGRHLVFRVELPGHGDSGGPGEGSISAYAKWVRMAVSEALKPGPYVLAGHSMGGAIALELAIDPPEMMKGLVLVGSGARLGVMPAIFRMLEEDPDKFFQSIDQVAFFSDTPPDVRELAIQSMRRCSPSVLLKDFKACNRFDIRDRLKEIRLPTLILCGRDDRLTPVKYSKYLHQNITDSRIVLIPQAGHMVMAEAPEPLNRVLEQFLDQIQM